MNHTKSGGRSGLVTGLWVTECCTNLPARSKLTFQVVLINIFKHSKVYINQSVLLVLVVTDFSAEGAKHDPITVQTSV